MYDKLTSMLQITETHDQTADIDRVNDLIKVSSTCNNSLKFTLRVILTYLFGFSLSPPPKTGQHATQQNRC